MTELTSIAGDGAAVRHLLDAGAAAVQTTQLAPGDRGAIAALAPEGYALHVREYDLAGDRPRRRQGTIRVEDVPSFAAYWLKHSEGDSEVYATFTETGGGSIEAVLNAPGGTDDRAGWRDHRVALNLAQTPEWRRWISGNDKLLEQQAFAEHIEAGLSQIVDPSGADMLEVAQTLTGSTRVEWESATRLSDGQTRFAHRETTEAQVRGDLEIPSEFTLVLRPWKATLHGVQITARLRWRIERGHASLGYVLVDLDKALEGASIALLKELGPALARDGQPDVVILRGTP